jgi:hypothetical protein
MCDPRVEWSPPAEWAGARNGHHGPEAVWDFMIEVNKPWEDGSYEEVELVVAGEDTTVVDRDRYLAAPRRAGRKARREAGNHRRESMRSLSIRRRILVPLAATALIAAGLLGAAAVVLAAHPVGGAKYKGQIANDPVNTKISFKVSDNGTKVRKLKTKADPVFFSDGCNEVTPEVEQESDPAHISRKGKFRGVIHYTYSNDAHAKAVVKGRFHRNGKERGSVKATFPANHTCDGKAHYSTEVD